MLEAGQCCSWNLKNGYGSIPINTIFRGMNIHLPAILMFTRGTRFWHTAKSKNCFLVKSPFFLVHPAFWVGETSPFFMIKKIPWSQHDGLWSSMWSSIYWESVWWVILWRNVNMDSWPIPTFIGKQPLFWQAACGPDPLSHTPYSGGGGKRLKLAKICAQQKWIKAN